MPDGPDHPETWVFHLAMAWLGNPDHSLGYKERLAMIKERAEELGEPARSAFTWIPPDTLVHKADISYWIMQPWDNHGGRMTLVGDAAHPMPPCESDVFNRMAPLSIFSSEQNPEGNKQQPTPTLFPPFSNLPLTLFPHKQTAVKASTTASAMYPTSSQPSTPS